MELGDISAWIPFYAGLAFLLVVGKVLRQQTVTLLAGLLAFTAAPIAASFFVAGVLCIAFRVVDLLNVG